MAPLPILLAAVFPARGTGFSKSFTGAFSSNSRLDVREVQAKSVTNIIDIFWDDVFVVIYMGKMDNLDVRLLFVENEALLTWNE